MPSPFPGMDSYLEMLEWQDFHLAMINEIRTLIAPQLRPNYLARIERRVFVERFFDQPSLDIPDVEVVASKQRSKLPRAVATAIATLEPHVYEVSVPLEHREPYLVIKDVEHRRVVTVIELLSPTNKASGSDGSRVYAEKRAELLQSSANLVEIDLLRGGRRPPTIRPIPDSTDYCVFVHRTPARSRVEVYEWTLRDPLPAVPVPLAGSDPDVPLCLQVAFDEIYDVAAYDLELPYHLSLDPPGRRSDVAWIRKQIVAWRARQQ